MQVITEMHWARLDRKLHPTVHIGYINILTWLRGFQDKLHIWCCFLCIRVPLGTERQEKLEIFIINILTRKLRSHVRILTYQTWAIIDKLEILDKWDSENKFSLKSFHQKIPSIGFSSKSSILLHNRIFHNRL